MIQGTQTALENKVLRVAGTRLKVAKVKVKNTAVLLKIIVKHGIF
jgi:hypothetical protein